MINSIALLLIMSFAFGQIIRIPFINSSAITILDIVSIFIILLGLIKSKFRLFNPPLFLKLGFLFALSGSVSLMLTPLNLTKEEFLISLAYTIRFCIYLFLGFTFLSRPFKNFSRKIIPILLYSGITLGTTGLLQFIFFPDFLLLNNDGWDPHFFRTVSTFLDPNFSGAFFVLTLLLFVQYPKIKGKLIRIFFFLIFFSLMTTFSRSSYLMFLISGIILALLRKSRKIFISTIVLFLILLLGFQIYIQTVANPKNISRQESAIFRVNSWEQGLTLFTKFPILGVGFNAYRFAIEEYNLGNEQFLKSHGSSSNDSSLLFAASTTGIVGLIIYLLFLASLFRYSYPDNPVSVAGLSGLLVHSIFANSLFYTPILAWLLLTSTIPKK